MAKSFSPVLRAGAKTIPIKGPDGEPVVFHCDFQWASGSYLCLPLTMNRGKFTMAQGGCNFRYSTDGKNNKYLNFPDYYFSLASYSFYDQPEYFLFPRYRTESAIVCAKIPIRQYLAANKKSVVNLFRIAGEIETAAVPFSQFDAQYKFDTLPTADDGTYWGVRYDKAFYGGIKRIA